MESLSQQGSYALQGKAQIAQMNKMMAQYWGRNESQQHQQQFTRTAFWGFNQLKKTTFDSVLDEVLFTQFTHGSMLISTSHVHRKSPELCWPTSNLAFDDQQTYLDPNQPPTISKIAYHSSLRCLSETEKLVIFSIIESILPVESFWNTSKPFVHVGQDHFPHHKHHRC